VGTGGIDRIMKKNKILRKAVKWTVGIGVALLLGFILLFEKIDRTPYREMAYYHQMMAQLDTFRIDTLQENGAYFKAGWARQSIVPAYMPDLAGYGIRDKASCINDSVYVRTFVFDNGRSKAAFITLDLLIFPPVVEQNLWQQLAPLGYTPANLYFSAVHTHNGPGGWAEGPAGRFLAGSYDQAYIDFVTAQAVASVVKAEQTLEPARIGYTTAQGSGFVQNRIVRNTTDVDDRIRIVKIQKESGEEAAIYTYSAHANCLKMKYTCVSADYPGLLTTHIEASGVVSFAMYAAGMVGSHIPFLPGPELYNQEYVEAYSDSLAVRCIHGLQEVEYTSGHQLYTALLDLPLRAPHLKVAQNWRVRPWLFRFLFGDYNPKIKILKIGKIVFVGTPCDFSGELMKDLEVEAEKKQLELIITSFNGGYIGYINADQYYDLDKAETRDMNWFGPYNQAYFTEIISRILKKI
jgi:neutral ceramidase